MTAPRPSRVPAQVAAALPGGGGEPKRGSERLFAFLRLPSCQWRSARTNAIERLHEEFKRRIETQTVLPSAETAAMLFWAELPNVPRAQRVKRQRRVCWLRARSPCTRSTAGKPLPSPSAPRFRLTSPPDPRQPRAIGDHPLRLFPHKSRRHPTQLPGILSVYKHRHSRCMDKVLAGFSFLQLLPFLPMLAMPAAAAGSEDLVDLANFGRTVGDGSDATAAIRAAMASVNAPAVKVPAGVYGPAPGAYVAGSTVFLVGDGIGRSIIRLPAACFQSGDLLQWVGCDDVLVRDLTLDLNGCAAGSLSSGLAVAGGHGLRLVRVSIMGAGAGPWLLASLNGVSHAQVVDSQLKAQAAQSSQNQAINVSASYAQGDDVLIEGNTLVNTGALADVTRLRFLGNDLSGWGYGAGIRTHPVYSADGIIAGKHRLQRGEAGVGARHEDAVVTRLVSQLAGVVGRSTLAKRPAQQQVALFEQPRLKG